MSIVERLEVIVKEKGLTFKRVERECGLGNGTIKRWESQSPRLDGLVKVSKYLQVSLDAIVFDGSESETSCDGVPLTESETDLVAMYRLLNNEDRKTIFDLTTLKYEQTTGERGSTYSTYSDTNKQQKSDSDEEPKAHPVTA